MPLSDCYYLLRIDTYQYLIICRIKLWSCSPLCSPQIQLGLVLKQGEPYAKENTENTTSVRNVLKRHFVSATMSLQNNSLEYSFTTTPATIFGMPQTFYPFCSFAISLHQWSITFCLKRALTLFTDFESKEEKLDPPNTTLQVFDIVNGTGTIFKDAPLCIRHFGFRWPTLWSRPPKISRQGAMMMCASNPSTFPLSRDRILSIDCMISGALSFPAMGASAIPGLMAQ